MGEGKLPKYYSLRSSVWPRNTGKVFYLTNTIGLQKIIEPVSMSTKVADSNRCHVLFLIVIVSFVFVEESFPSSAPPAPKVCPILLGIVDRESAKRIPTAVFEAFEDVIPDITLLELTRLTEGDRSPLPPEIRTVFEAGNGEEGDYAPRENNSLQDSTVESLTVIYNIVRKMKPPNSSSKAARLSKDEVESLTIFLGERLLASPKEKIVLDRFENTDSDTPLPKKPRRPRDTADNSIQDDLISILNDEVAEEPTATQRELVHGIVIKMIAGGQVRGPRKVLQEFLLPDPGKRRATLSKLESEWILNWIEADFFYFLKQHYFGFEGQRRFAGKFRNGTMFNTWQFARPYLSFEKLKELGWESSRWGITHEHFDKIEALIADWPHFYVGYQGRQGLKRLADEWFSGDIPNTYSVLNKLIPENRRYYMFEIRGNVPFATFDGKDEPLPRYRGKKGPSHFLDDIAELRVHTSDPSIPDERSTWSSEHEKVFHRAREKARFAAANLFSPWKREPETAREVLLANYSGTAGMMRFAREHDLGAKKLRKWADEHYGNGTANELGWKSIFMSVSKYDRLRNLVLEPDGHINQELRGYPAYYRYVSDNYSHDFEGADTDARVLFTKEQFMQLHWKEENLTYDVWSVFKKQNYQIGNKDPQLLRAFQQSQWVSRRILNKEGTPKEAFKGTLGMARYAALFHRGQPREAALVAKFCLPQGSYQALDWTSQESMKYEEVIRQSFRERWVPVSSAEGTVDPSYQGESGLIKYLIYRKLPAREARAEMKELLSAEEYSSLQWDSVK